MLILNISARRMIGKSNNLKVFNFDGNKTKVSKGTVIIYQVEGLENFRGVKFFTI
jgi:hypothetical protein